MSYAVVDFPAPTPCATPCPACQGTGLVPELRYELATDGPTLMVDVFCPACWGCGNGDPEHEACEPRAHVGDRFDLDDELDELEECCPFCQGRGWNPVQGFNDEVERWLRVPCGCTSDRVRLVAAT